jgi:hypothetical protein
MSKSTLIAGGFSLLLLVAGTASANKAASISESLTAGPVIDVAALHCVDADRNPFPTQAMATAFADYLRWTKAEGLSRLAAFKVLAHPDYADQVQLPSEQMAEQFEAYLDWTKAEGLSPYYAFNVTNFD